MLSIAELNARVLPHIDKDTHCPPTANKGAAGLLLETIGGIKHGPNLLDCIDGELKASPIKTSHGNVVPKETMAITIPHIAQIIKEDYDKIRAQ